ncbi:hypothetical protein Tco_0143451 [Tanacetum coccineum]
MGDVGDKNPIRTLGDYSKPSHEGYRNTIELPKGIDYASGGRLRKLRPDEAWAAIERLAQYEDKGLIDALIPDEVSLNYENPDIKQLLGIIEKEFMEFSLEVARRLKERIKENENKPRKIKKITKYQDTKVLENSAKYEFLENLEKKTFPTSTNLLCDLSNTTKALNKQVRSVQKDQQEVSEDRRIIVNGDAPAANCTS